MSTLSFVYYCSGHGYGHATRVSAFTRHLLSLSSQDQQIVVHIVSSAPEHVFADSIACGAKYRYAEIDPVIVQPVAYRVDRRKSVDVLKKFLVRKDELLARERAWLRRIQANGVLSDAAFLGCLAAKMSGIPSVLVTNFSFDSVYSFLSTPLQDVEPSTDEDDDLSLVDSFVPDEPIPHFELAPLVDQIYSGYQCADLLVRLPGHIPMPSFFRQPSLPAFDWVNVDTRRLLQPVLDHLLANPDTQPLHSAIPFPTGDRFATRQRAVVQAPLIVRPPSELGVYTPEGRSKLLSSIGVPLEFHEPATTKILIVSFGGQVIKKPSRPPSRTGSSRSFDTTLVDSPGLSPTSPSRKSSYGPTLSPERSVDDLLAEGHQAGRLMPGLHVRSFFRNSPFTTDFDDSDDEMIATPNHLYIPGAPPANKHHTSASMDAKPMVAEELVADVEELLDTLLPDPSWIAIVCGVSKDQWGEDEEDLPERFFIAPKNVYMPDLTAVGDVLLGKLGYGTVSECVDACTPFVYVSRPLFVEEHGLRLLLDKEGVGMELSRKSYEAGEWSHAVAQAYAKGRLMKETKRSNMSAGIDVDKREKEVNQLAKDVIGWFKDWDSLPVSDL